MSPALLDPGGASSSAPKGQASSVPFKVDSIGSFSVSQSKLSQETMNPSSSFGFGGDFSSGFSNSAQNNTNFSFNTPSLQRPSGGLARPRFVKIRKQLSSQNLKSSGNLETGVGPGFNPFRPVSSAPQLNPSDGSDMGGNLEREVVEEMRNLRVGKSCGFDDQSLFSKLPEDIRKLNINDGSKGDQGNGNDGNVGSCVRRGVETEKLPNELQTKLNIKGGEGAYGGAMKDFVFKGSEKSRNPLVGSMTDVHDGIKNLKLKGSDDSNANERAGFVSMSSKSAGTLGGETEKVLSTEMERKLNMGSVMGDSSKVFGKDVQTEKLGDKKLPEFGKSGQTESTFQAATPAKQDGTPFAEFRTPDPRTNIFSGSNRNLEFNSKREAGTSTKVKKRKGKLKQPTPVQLWHGQDFISSKTGSQDDAEATESYSPMDVSPYQETLAHTQCSRESSIDSDEPFGIDITYASCVSQSAASIDLLDEDLVAATQHMNINEGEEKDEERGSANVFDKGIAAEAFQEDYVSGAETESFVSAAEEIDNNTDVALSSAETEASSRSNIERQDSDGQTYFASASTSEHTSGFDFTFAASSSAQSQLSSSKRQSKKKNLAKIPFDPPNSSLNMRIPYVSSSAQFSPYPGASLLLSPGRGQKMDVSTLESKVGDNIAVDKGPQVKHESNLTSASTAAQESCEKWRLSNRAATRMSLGRMKDALGDCIKAAAIDPNFLKVQLRMAK
ncbi:Tetratricopeptide-like helical [Corchorus olitorius]|uniref:Tetratricopeptide-like helical n=1 Tax=Corchorus olitorius TaxID=93759 RepID=A0A1R3G8P7_9ROSI|nr:Tetratricopeptide-like helical [Corchorus olitorius]